MKNIKLILSAALLTTLFSCINNDNYSAPDLTGECSDLTATKTVQNIATLATSTAQQYTADDVIEAYVTSSDEGGNFYKSISMVSMDGTKGFSMPVDAYNLYTKYEPGRKVYIKMQNRYFANNSQTASLEIGSLYNGSEVGRLSGVEYEAVVKRGCTKVDENTLVNTLTIAAAKNNANLNKLIEINNIQFTDASLGKKYFDPTVNNFGGATNHEIADIAGNKMIIRVSEFATFASRAVATGSGKIRGVLTKYGSDFQFMIRTENDVQMDNVRFDGAPPIVGNALVFGSTLNEPFTSYTTTNQQIFPKYINDAAIGTRYWQLKTFGGNKYIQMSSFGGTPEANRTLFFVPIDFTGASTVSFKTKAGFANGACLKVYQTTNYVAGSDVNTATLTNITSSFTIDPGLATGYPTNFTNSGNWSIPGTLTGNGYLVFEYIGNGNGGVTTTMQIDDIVIN
ncbi:MAG: DUF5689 domain-containing protein [Bacteroidota bacterium]